MKCHFVKPTGQECSAPAMESDTYCYFHSPKVAAQRTAARVEGGRKARAKNLAPKGPPPPDVHLDEGGRTAVVKLMSDVINQVRREECTLGQANAIAYLCQVVLRALPDEDTERRLKEVEKKTAALSHLTHQQLLEIVEKGVTDGAGH